MGTFRVAHIFGGRSTHTPTSNPSVPRYIDEIGLVNADLGDGTIYHFEMTEAQLWRVLHDMDRAQLQTKITGTVYYPAEDGVDFLGYTTAHATPSDFVLDVETGYLPTTPPVRGFTEDLIALSESGSPLYTARGSLLLGTLDFGKVEGTSTYHAGIAFYANLETALRFRPGGWMKLPRGPIGTQTYLCEFELGVAITVAPATGYEFATGFQPPAAPPGWTTVFSPLATPASVGTVKLHVPFDPGTYGLGEGGVIGAGAQIVELLSSGDPSLASYGRVRISEVNLYSTGSHAIRTLP